MKPNPLVGVALDGPTWLWLRRRHPGYIAKRLATGYKVIGHLERAEEDEREDSDECETENLSLNELSIFTLQESN